MRVEVEANGNIGDEVTSQMYSAMIARLKKALVGGTGSSRQALGTMAGQKVVF
jgi:hypothetical protein